MIQNIQDKAAIIKNLEVLLAAVEAQPERLFDLNYFRKERECGTCFCIAGLACELPYFQALGMYWHDYDPSYKGVSVWHGGGDELFGPASMDELFHANGDGTIDEDLGLPFYVDEWGDVKFRNDKELAIARIKHRIATYKGEQ